MCVCVFVHAHRPWDSTLGICLYDNYLSTRGPRDAEMGQIQAGGAPHCQVVLPWVAWSPGSLLAIAHSTGTLEQRACSALLDPEAIDFTWQFKTNNKASELEGVNI